MSQHAVQTKLHLLLHSAKEAICSTDWSDMQGDDAVRTCPDCGTVAYKLDHLGPERFCSEYEEHCLDDRTPHVYRRTDGTYTFTETNCSPKKMLTPMRSDMRAVSICNWWSDRFERYNRILFSFGLVVGGGAAILLSFMNLIGAIGGLICFIGGALVCATLANLMFAGCVLTNLLIPNFLRPIRKYFGPVSLSLSMTAMGILMVLPLVLAVVGWIQQIAQWIGGGS